jgi:hypothetical protein
MPNKGVAWTWKRLCLRIRRHTCDEVSLPATERFWTSFYRLGQQQKESCRRAWQIFKHDPFDARLRPHKIHRLSAQFGRTIYAAVIEDDLRLLFYLEGYYHVLNPRHSFRVREMNTGRATAPPRGRTGRWRPRWYPSIAGPGYCPQSLRRPSSTRWRAMRKPAKYNFC